jgi:ectoine hydroxylase-related dioxygenase (phytanoyl-CoA dioxygenase family)
LFLPQYFSQSEIALLKAELPRTFAEKSPRRVVEREGHVVRSVYGQHADNETFSRLTRHPRLVEPARQMVNSDVYVYQFKVNAKAAFSGDVWDWHQDFIFWSKEDGMPAPRVTNVMIFIDEVNDFNGPLFLIPGSHRSGIIDMQARETGSDQASTAYQGSPAWINNLTADLKYSLSRETVARLAAHHGLAAPKGPAGSVLFFDSNLVHASPNNISPFDRVVVIITFNSTENVPVQTRKRRPEFLVSRDHHPIVPLADDALVSSGVHHIG